MPAQIDRLSANTLLSIRSAPYVPVETSIGKQAPGSSAMSGQHGLSPDGGLSIREARSDDASQACDLVRCSIVELCFLDHEGDRGKLSLWLADKTPENFRIWIAQSHVFIAERDGKIVGVAVLTGDGGISLNYVLPAERFTGVSRALLLAIEERARDLGLEQCTLETTQTGLRFYVSAGYTDLECGSRRHTLIKRL